MLAALVLLTRVPNDNKSTRCMTTVMNSCEHTVYQNISARRWWRQRRYWLSMRSMHDITGSDDSICGRSDKLLPWETIQKLILICIVSIDDRLYNELTNDISDLFWTSQDTQTQHPKTIRSTATIGLEVSWVDGGSIECTHTRNTNTNSACSRFGVWKKFLFFTSICDWWVEKSFDYDHRSIYIYSNGIRNKIPVYQSKQ